MNQPDLDTIIERVGTICEAFPDAYRETAWLGMRWRIRAKTFAHVAPIENGSPPAYSAASGLTDDAIVVTFQSTGDELEVLTTIGLPYFKPTWSPTIVGLVLTGDTDFDEVAELLTESYCLQAPQKLAMQVSRPPR